jgi:antimicrobial peptide system SdpA family protein
MKVPTSRFVGIPRSRLAKAMTLIVCTVLATGYLPGRVVQVPGGRGLTDFAAALLPESWAFFTKNPKESRYLVLVEGSNSTLTFVDDRSQAEPESFFGLNRTARIRQSERYGIGEAVSPESWYLCDDPLDVDRCFASFTKDFKTTRVEIAGYRQIRSYCGDYVVLKQEPLRWAWRQSPNDYEVAIAPVSVVCD